MRMAGMVLGILAVAGCATIGGGAGPAARADLKDARGQRVGTATLIEQDGKVRIVVQARGLSPGQHGIHVHAVGRCDPPEFESAGGHFDPLGRKHGLEAPDGAHAGDLPNLTADPRGNARYEATSDRITLREGRLSVFDADGSALVIHQGPDDQKTDPAGNSGPRVACGVLEQRAPGA